MTDRETLDVYDQRAADYADLIGKAGAPDAQLQSFLDHLPDAARVLDLGCGPGRAAGMMAAAGHQVTATDASASMIALAAQHPGVAARQESFDDLTGTAIYEGIWANFSLLHARPEDLPRHLGAIAEALTPKGLFHIGMKTGDGMERDALGRRYIYVTEASLTALLAEAGLTPFAQWTGQDKGFAGTYDPWIVMQARKDG